GDPPALRREPSGVLVSLSAHAVVCVLLYLGLHRARTVESNSNPPRFAVRIMELRKEEPKIQVPVLKAIVRPDELPDSRPKAPLPAPSKTSPIAVPATQQAQQMPETASKNAGKPTPAGVMSASTIQLQEGTATLPMINEVAPAPYAGALSAGQPKNLSVVGQ